MYMCTRVYMCIRVCMGMCMYTHTDWVFVVSCCYAQWPWHYVHLFNARMYMYTHVYIGMCMYNHIFWVFVVCCFYAQWPQHYAYLFVYARVCQWTCSYVGDVYMYMYLHVHFGYGFVTKLCVVVFYNSTLQRDVYVSTCTFWVLFCAVSMHSGRSTSATCLYVRKYVRVYTSMEVHTCMCSFMHRCIHICWVFVVCCSEAVALRPQHTATHCNNLQHTASHCITLQRRPF